MNLKNTLKKILPVLPVFLLAFLPVAHADTAASEQARALVEKAADAYGGKSNWEGKGVLVVHEVQTRYTDEGSTEVGIVHYLDTRGRGYRLEWNDLSGKRIYGWDGSRFWAVADGKAGGEDLVSEARRIISDAFYRFSLPFILGDAGAGAVLEYAGKDEVNGTPTEVVMVTYAGDPAGRYFQTHDAGHERDTSHGADASAEEGGHGGGHHSGNQVYYYHIDKDYRIVKIHFSHHGDGRFESLYPEDYRDLEGILMERSRRLLREGEKLYDSRFTGMEFRGKGDEGRFLKPRM